MRRALDIYYRFLKLLLTVLMGVLMIPVSLQIFSRYIGLLPRYIWTEELARFCFIWIILVGAMIAVWQPDSAAWAAASAATKVFPAPTSPCSIRVMREGRAISA